MKAIVVREFGPPSVMRYEEVPTPEPGPGEVLIKVHAVSVNRTLDAVVRAGKYAKKVELPLTPGVDPSGIVAKVGPDVTMRKVGDRVTVQLRTGNEAGNQQQNSGSKRESHVRVQCGQPLPSSSRGSDTTGEPSWVQSQEVQPGADCGGIQFRDMLAR